MEGHYFPGWKGPLRTRTVDEESPILWYLIKKARNTRDRIFSKLLVREKRKKPMKQGLIKKDLIATSLEKLQTPDSTIIPSKFGEEITSNLEFYNISKLPDKYYGHSNTS